MKKTVLFALLCIVPLSACADSNPVVPAEEPSALLQELAEPEPTQSPEPETEGLPEEPSPEPEIPEEPAVTGQDIAEFAMQYVGYNYCWAGADPEKGFDCSGLVFYTYGNFGYGLNRVANDMTLNGRAVTFDELLPGDILCFCYGSGYVYHVGIYIGEGQYVHACDSNTGVIVSELDEKYKSAGLMIRRIID